MEENNIGVNRMILNYNPSQWKEIKGIRNYK